MPRSPESSSFNPVDFKASSESTTEKPEQKIETVHVSLDLTINKALVKERSGIHATFISEQHVEGELDSLLYALDRQLYEAEKSVEMCKATPVYNRWDNTKVDEERTQQLIEFNERAVRNLKSLIEKFQSATAQS